MILTAFEHLGFYFSSLLQTPATNNAAMRLQTEDRHAGDARAEQTPRTKDHSDFQNVLLFCI